VTKLDDVVGVFAHVRRRCHTNSSVSVVSKWAYNNVSVVDVYMSDWSPVQSGICMMTDTSAACVELAGCCKVSVLYLSATKP